MITEEAINKLYERLTREAEAGGYHLNPDVDFTRDLVRGLLINEARYGYQACPCRLASGVKNEDMDIICPCDYRDPDLEEYGACYCALYVSDAVLKGEKTLGSIPERRAPGSRLKGSSVSMPSREMALPYPVWRCRVCGYLCARGKPPLVCPICKVTQERFERFI